jgi:hypothetical protein
LKPPPPVKSILLNETYAKAIFIEAKIKHGSLSSKTTELEKLKVKISSLQNQIEATTERITELPKGIDAKPFYDQLLKLQEHKENFEQQLLKEKSNQENADQPIDFGDFQKFAEGLKQLTEKCSDPDVQAAIIRKIVSKIEVTPNSVIIHYHVGKTHYTRELGDTINGIQDAKSSLKALSNDKAKGSVDFTKPFTKKLLKFTSNDACSNTLKFGSEGRT